MNSESNYLFIDLFNGISGDMLISAFVDAGLPPDLIIKEIKNIDILDEVDLKFQKKTHFGLSGTFLKIKENPLKKRKFKDLEDLLNPFPLAKKILKTLAIAEAKIHNINLNDVHFHEIGAIDTIIDCIGVSVGIEYFKIEKCYISEIPVGKGKIKISHGLYPNPAPATIEILKSYKLNFLNTEKELTTPTGAAILKALEAEQIENFSFIPYKIGYGLGAQSFSDRPNCLRIFIGKKFKKIDDYNSKIIEINFNIDDMTGEELGYFIENAMKNNIIDISVIPTITKKNRPGYLITILVNEIDDRILRFIFQNTSTSGIRFCEKKRFILDRYFEGNKKIFKSEKLKIKKWKFEFDKIKGGEKC